MLHRRDVIGAVGLMMAAGRKSWADVSPQAAVIDLLERAVAEGGPGFSCAIGTRAGIAWEGAAGFANYTTKASLNAAHCLGAGSITKLLAAVLTMKLVELRHLSLSDTPQRVLDDETVQGIANARTATVAHLLNHTSGIPSWEDDPVWIREGRGRAVDVAHTWRKPETLNYIRGKGETNSPGGAFHYSNSNFTLLGLMIEKVTGRTFEQELRDRVLDPVGLHGSWLEGFETGLPCRLPRRYHFATAEFREKAGIALAFDEVAPGLIDVTPSNLSVEWAAGGLIAPPADLVRFGIALRAGRLLEPASLAFLRQWRAGMASPCIGHSLFQFRDDQVLREGHHGNVLGFNAALWWSENPDVVVAIQSNVGSMHSGKTATTAYQLAHRPAFVKAVLDVAADFY